MCLKWTINNLQWTLVVIINFLLEWTQQLVLIKVSWLIRWWEQEVSKQDINKIQWWVVTMEQDMVLQVVKWEWTPCLTNSNNSNSNSKCNSSNNYKTNNNNSFCNRGLQLNSSNWTLNLLCKDKLHFRQAKITRLMAKEETLNSGD